MKFYVVYEEGSNRRLFFCHTQQEAEKFIRENPNGGNLLIRVGTLDDISVADVPSY